MKTIFCVALLCGATSFAADVLTEKLQRGLFEEEANRNLDAAIKEYQSVVTQSDEQRKVIATALFRLGECYRKLGKTNEANAQYQRVLRDFSEQEQLVKLARELLPGGTSLANSNAPAIATMTSVEAGELIRVKALAQNSPDLLNTPHKEGLTPLQFAAREGWPSVVEFLIAQGINVSGPERGTPPIVLAAQGGHLRIVELLLNHGADVDASNVAGFTVLMGAVDRGFKSIAELLFARGADVNRVTVGNSTALHLAVAQGRSNLVALLLAKNANPNVLASSNPKMYSPPGPSMGDQTYDTCHGFTPMHAAARLSSPAIAEMLVKAGASVNATNWVGATPLHIAVSAGQTKTVRLLLAQSADPNARDGDGATPLGLAVQKSTELTEALLAAGAKVNEPAYERPGFVTFPLHLAAAQPKPDILRALLAAKPNLEAKDNLGFTPLWSALMYNQNTNLAMLIDSGADARKRIGKETPIQRAARNVSESAVSLLLKAGANPNQVDEKGDSLLHEPVRWRKVGVVRLLLEAGANPNVLNSKQETPYSIAEAGSEGRMTSGSNEQERQRSREEWQRIAAILKQHGADVFLQRRMHITARRDSYSPAVFTRGTNTLNQFTLMELLGAVYQNGGFTFEGYHFLFPEFSGLRIHRIEGDKITIIPVDILSALQKGDCARDQWLEWGDEVEIPESVHPLNTAWNALPGDEAATLRNCVARTVRVLVGGTNVAVRLQPFVRLGVTEIVGLKYTFAYLPIFLRNEPRANGLLRSSSDLTRVTVRRTDPQTKEIRTMTFDTTDVAIPNATSGSIPLSHSLWLRDGDVIEIPEKQ